MRVQTRASLTVCKQDEVFPAPIEWRIQQNYRQKRTHSDRVTFWASCRSQKEEEYAIQFIHIFINKNYFLTINECFFSSCSSAFTIFITTHCLLLETSECWWWWKYKLILSTAVKILKKCRGLCTDFYFQFWGVVVNSGLARYHVVADQLELLLESRQRKQGFRTTVYCANKLGLAIEIFEAPKTPGLCSVCKHVDTAEI